MTFYMTYHYQYPDIILPMCERKNIPMMVNASSRWSDATGRFLDLIHTTESTPLVIDSGGYNVQHNHGEYPWTVEQYHEWLRNLDRDFEWAAGMDYACEEDFDDIWSVEERRKASLDNLIKHLELDPDYKVLPVLQGRTINQWLEYYDWLEDHGIDTSYVGLGTVCRQANSKKIVEIENALRERTNIDKIHGFGVKIEAYKYGASFETADSEAWAYESANGRVGVFTGGGYERFHCDDDVVRKTTTFLSYYLYVKHLRHHEVEGNSAMEW